MFAHNATERNVVLRVLRVWIAARNAGNALPVDQIVRARESGLITGAVEADIEHVEDAVMQKDEGIIHAFRVEGVRIGRSRKGQFPVFVRSTERRDLCVVEWLGHQARIVKKRGGNRSGS